MLSNATKTIPFWASRCLAAEIYPQVSRGWRGRWQSRRAAAFPDVASVGFISTAGSDCWRRHGGGDLLPLAETEAILKTSVASRGRMTLVTCITAKNPRCLLARQPRQRALSPAAQCVLAWERQRIQKKGDIRNGRSP